MEAKVKKWRYIDYFQKSFQNLSGQFSTKLMVIYEDLKQNRSKSLKRIVQSVLSDK